jgi:glycosyltransferase involved in cell wall biosynthesis
VDIVDLSIVIIARNEEKNIGKSVESVLAAVEEAKKSQIINTAEVIFVDSASNDRTVEIAKSYPVCIIELKKDWPLSPGAGIYAGYKASKGTYFAVIDGDTQAHRYWFRDALPYLQNDEKTGVVYGWWEEGSQGDGLLYIDMLLGYETFKVNCAQEVDFVGNGIFRRSALERVGGHNPYLRGSEDKDISFRLRNSGFKLLQIPVQLGIHYWDFSYLEYYRSMRGWSMGEGHAAAYAKANGNLQVFRWFSNPYSTDILFRVLRHTVLTAALLISMVCAVVLKGIWCWITLVLFALLATLLLKMKRRNSSPWKVFLFNYFHRIPYTLYRHWYFHKGLRLPTPDPKTYPAPTKKA